MSDVREAIKAAKALMVELYDLDVGNMPRLEETECEFGWGITFSFCGDRHRIYKRIDMDGELNLFGVTSVAVRDNCN